MWAPGFYPRAVRGFQREPTSSLALKPGQCCSTGSLTAGAASGSPCPLAAPPTGALPRRHTTLRRRIVSKLTKDITESSPLAVMLADAGAPAVLALTPLAVVLADAGAPEVVAPAPDAVMLADAGAPAVLALAPLAVVLAFLAPPPRLRCASRWKGPLVNWAQQRECVRRKDSLHTGQARAQSSSAARSGAGATDADMARLGHALMTLINCRDESLQ